MIRDKSQNDNKLRHKLSNWNVTINFSSILFSRDTFLPKNIQHFIIIGTCTFYYYFDTLFYVVAI